LACWLVRPDLWLWDGLRWVLLLNCCVAMGVNLAILSYLRYLNALLLLFAAYFKDIVTVLIAVIVSGESINSTEIQGYALLLIGFATWRYMAYLKDAAKKNSPRPPVEDDVDKETASGGDVAKVAS
jgi:drug/metabolite transporter (DMT)-like permease